MKKAEHGVKFLLWLGALFFLVEFFLHFFGLPVLEHDKIFLPTHDRYIALFALTYAALLFLAATDLSKYKMLFKLTMLGILLAMLNATWIAYAGGYIQSFPVTDLDKQIGIMGIFAWIWYILVLALYTKTKQTRKSISIRK